MAVTDSTPIGARFGSLTVSGLPFKIEGKGNHHHVLCKCDCGGEKTVQCYNIVKGYTTSCGCVQKRAAAKAQTKTPSTVPGDVFGRMAVIGEPFKNGGTDPWLVSCRCECGAEKDAQCSLLLNGNVKSCGCLNSDATAQRNRDNTKHGHAANEERPTPTYITWLSVKSRCLNSKSEGYAKYGARGINICDRWRDSFENFLADMGERPEGMTIDRWPDGKGNYEPGNCRWATPQKQAENRSTTVWLDHGGEVKTLSQIAREVGIDKGTLHSRLEMGWTLERATTEPVRSRK